MTDMHERFLVWTVFLEIVWLRICLPVKLSLRSAGQATTVLSHKCNIPTLLEGRRSCVRQSLATTALVHCVAATWYRHPSHHASVITPCFFTPCLTLPEVLVILAVGPFCEQNTPLEATSSRSKPLFFEAYADSIRKGWSELGNKTSKARGLDFTVVSKKGPALWHLTITM